MIYSVEIGRTVLGENYCSLSQSEMANVLGITVGTVNSSIKRLIDDDLVEPRQQKVRRYKLTEQGKNLVKKFRKKIMLKIVWRHLFKNRNRTSLWWKIHKPLQLCYCGIHLQGRKEILLWDREVKFILDTTLVVKRD